MNEAAFMVQHRAALDRLKSIRLSSRLSISSAARLSMRARNSIRSKNHLAPTESPALGDMLKKVSVENVGTGVTDSAASPLTETERRELMDQWGQSQESLLRSRADSFAFRQNYLIGNAEASQASIQGGSPSLAGGGSRLLAYERQNS